MKQPAKSFPLESQSVTDRGLNERRPLNEDSFLADVERRIFAVADGVGGAEAGEVASKTAVEVLEEAFRHQVDGEDIEDLMELAIQRANASIHQMAQESTKFTMMATTIVALHLNGNIATIAHVGDSRLYRLTPDGNLVRETEDHSIVEEEVRAGRMTVEQAATHPSKNVISRALGAEDSVEVDLKTMEVESGTEFLLCTDGITRHITDNEIRQLLITQESLSALCEELKARCYERGAEDNLTAVVLRCGPRIHVDERHEDMQPTISPESERARARSRDYDVAFAGDPDNTDDPLVPASRMAFPGGPQQVTTPDQRLNLPASNTSRRSNGGSMGRIFLFLLVLVAVAGAFYGGRRYKGPIPLIDKGNALSPQPTPGVASQGDHSATFEAQRRQIDTDPNGWLNNQLKEELTVQHIQNPIESSDPEFLYLYGRALLLAGNTEEAAQAFEKAIVSPSSADSTARRDATLALAALALKSDKEKARALTHLDEMLPKPASTSSP